MMTDSAYSVMCVSCGAAQQMPDDDFCGRCGRRLPKRTCPACERASTTTASFCGYCGAALDVQHERHHEPELTETEPTSVGHFGVPVLDNSKKAYAVIAVSLVILVVASGAIGVIVRKRHGTQTSNAISQTSPPAQAAPPPSKLLTKDPEFLKLLHLPQGDEVLEGFPEYRERKNAIESRLAAIQDPDLRQRASSEEWAKVDKEQYRKQAQEAQRQYFSANMRKCLEKHRTDWFEVGHLGALDGTDRLQVTSVEASPVEFPSTASLRASIAEVDSVYAKFRQVASAQIDQAARSLMYERSCEAQLRNVCTNLGGTSSECSDPARIREIWQRLGSGLALECNDNLSVDEARRKLEAEMRPNRVVLVAQGDLLEHRIDKLLIIDYDTETVLGDFAPTALEAQMMWKFPEASRPNLYSSSSYVRASQSDTLKDFGVVPVHGEGTTHEQFHFKNSGSVPVRGSLSMVDDPEQNFKFENGCSSGVIEGGDECVVTISFKPVSPGTHVAKLIVDGSGWQWNSVTLRGFGALPWDIYGDRQLNARTEEEGIQRGGQTGAPKVGEKTNVLTPEPRTAASQAIQPVPNPSPMQRLSEESDVRPANAGGGRIRVTQGVSEGLLLHKVSPTYPPLARQARIQGTVVFAAVIGKDGSIQNLRAVSGHPMLTPAAIEAVKQWRYKPYFLKGEAVEVETQITVNFMLSGG